MSYTGAAVDGAKVKYRVVREVRWPYWWTWYSWRRPQIQGSQEIAHGTATTETDGSFKIEFFAKPDPNVSEKEEASFSFSIYADATDTAGETRSDQRSVNVGFTALQATLSAADWLTEGKPVELTIKTETLDGEPQAAEGSLKIYRLQEPAQVRRPPLTGRYDLGDEAAGAKYWTTDLQGKVVDQCVQLHGGYGFMTEYEVSRLWRDARVQRIYGGTNEIMKEIIGRSMGF